MKSFMLFVLLFSGTALAQESSPDRARIEAEAQANRERINRELEKARQERDKYIQQRQQIDAERSKAADGVE